MARSSPSAKFLHRRDIDIAAERERSASRRGIIRRQIHRVNRGEPRARWTRKRERENEREKERRYATRHKHYALCFMNRSRVVSRHRESANLMHSPSFVPRSNNPEWLLCLVRFFDLPSFLSEGNLAEGGERGRGVGWKEKRLEALFLLRSFILRATKLRNIFRRSERDSSLLSSVTREGSRKRHLRWRENWIDWRIARWTIDGGVFPRGPR